LGLYKKSAAPFSFSRGEKDIEKPSCAMRKRRSKPYSGKEPLVMDKVKNMLLIIREGEASREGEKTALMISS